jgi:hypothetical protein
LIQATAGIIRSLCLIGGDPSDKGAKALLFAQLKKAYLPLHERIMLCK